jgi:IS5 family transposase
MREQQTFGDIEYNNKKRKTRREMFLEQMEAVIPWQQWVK